MEEFIARLQKNAIQILGYLGEEFAMIVNRSRVSIFEAPQKHIAFAVNSRGDNEAGFAGQIIKKYWPDIAYTGTVPFGKAFSHAVDGKVIHAMVCFALGRGGWRNTPEFVTKCLDSLEVPADEEIAMVLMGGGPIGQRDGADVDAILAGVERSKMKVVVYPCG